MQKNDLITLQITEINNLGAGVGKCEDGRVVFVHGAVTGDHMEARVIKVNKNFQTSDPDIYAVGDAIEFPNFFTGKPGRLALAGPAQRLLNQLKTAFRNIVAGLSKNRLIKVIFR